MPGPPAPPLPIRNADPPFPPLYPFPPSPHSRPARPPAQAAPWLQVWAVQLYPLPTRSPASGCAAVPSLTKMLTNCWMGLDPTSAALSTNGLVARRDSSPVSGFATTAVAELRPVTADDDGRAVESARPRIPAPPCGYRVDCTAAAGVTLCRTILFTGPRFRGADVPAAASWGDGLPTSAWAVPANDARPTPMPSATASPPTRPT